MVWKGEQAMNAIVLEPNLRKRLEQDAAEEVRSVNDLVNEAVARYLRERQEAKIDREIAAFDAMHVHLTREHLEEWVAVHDQELVDHDSDRVALYRRIRTRYGRTAVLIRQVTASRTDEVWLRTPAAGRIS